MQAWLCENPTGVEALQWKELPTPEPKAGEVRIAIRAASLNFPDLLIVQNKYQMKPPLPFVPGSEYAGTVEAVGEGVKHLKAGDAVAAFGGTGGFGTHAVVNAGLVMPLPAGFPFDDAAAMTRAPRTLPIWIAAVPTPPAAPRTSSVSPLLSWPRSTSAWWVVP